MKSVTFSLVFLCASVLLFVVTGRWFQDGGILVTDIVLGGAAQYCIASWVAKRVHGRRMGLSSVVTTIPAEALNLWFVSMACVLLSDFMRQEEWPILAHYVWLSSGVLCARSISVGYYAAERSVLSLMPLMRPSA